MSEPNTNPAATSFPSPIISLPMGAGVLKTYSGALVCLEIVSICSEFDQIVGYIFMYQWPRLCCRSLLIINWTLISNVVTCIFLSLPLMCEMLSMQTLSTHPSSF